MKSLISAILAIVLLCSCAKSPEPVAQPEKPEASSAEVKISASSANESINPAISNSANSFSVEKAENQKPSDDYLSKQEKVDSINALEDKNGNKAPTKQPENRPTVYQPPLSEPLPAADENGWIKLNCTDITDSFWTQGGFYWLDNNRAVGFFSPDFICIDLAENKYSKLISLTDNTFIETGTRFFMYNHPDLVRGKPIPENEGFCFTDNQQSFIVPTAGKYGTTYTFSSKDLSLISDDPSLYRISDYAPFYDRDGVLLNGNKLEHDQYISTPENPIRLKSYIHPEQPYVDFEFDKSSVYTMASSSPSGKYFAFCNVTKTGGTVVEELFSREIKVAVSADDPIPVYRDDFTVYIEIFDDTGKFISAIVINDWSNNDNEMFLQQNYERILNTNKDLIRLNNRYYNADGTVAEFKSYYFIRKLENEEFPNGIYCLFKRFDNGKEQLIKENIASYSSLQLTINQSLTACVWKDTYDGKCYLGINRWELP